MGIDTISTYDDLIRRLENPSIWPAGEEGQQARAALTAAVLAATRHVEDDSARLEKGKRCLVTILRGLGQ